MKETNSPENCSSPVKMFLFFLSLSQTEKYFTIFLVSSEKKKILWNSFVFVSLKKKSWKNVSLLPKSFFITNTWEKKTIFNFIIQFHAYGKKIWKNGNIYFTLTHEKKISWQIWFSGPNFTNEKENFSRFFFHTFTKEGNQFSWKKNPLTSTSGKMMLFYFLISLNFTHDKEIWEFSIYVYFTFTCKRKKQHSL